MVLGFISFIRGITYSLYRTYSKGRTTDGALVCMHNQKAKWHCNSKVDMDLLAGVNSSNGIPHNHPPEFEEQLRCRAMAEVIQEI